MVISIAQRREINIMIFTENPPMVADIARCYMLRRGVDNNERSSKSNLSFIAFYQILCYSAKN